jgi:hypothetical protein
MLIPGFLVLVATPVVAQQGNGLPDGVTREQMWFAPSAEDWAKPTLIPWQRTWADAMELSAQTEKAILVCVNMDGEIASEHWAGIRYRQPEIAAHFEDYVCVIASTFRHNPRDYDAAGQRIPCPRFGVVTCGEHIWMEPTVYDLFLDDTRVAPRHIMVELDGSETYDLYYALDIDTIVTTLQDGILQREIKPEDTPKGDRSLAELVASPDASDRAQVEMQWQDGDRQARQEILAAAVDLGAKAPVDLLREAAYGFDSELSTQALDLLAQSSDDKAVGLINDLLQGPMEAERREKLLMALDRLGEQVPVAKRLAMVHRGLNSRSELLDLDAWSEGLAQGKATVSNTEAADLLAEAVLPDNLASLLGNDPRARRVAEQNFREARSLAEADLAAGDTDWVPFAIVALASNYLNEKDQVLPAAQQAVQLLPPGDTSWNAYAVLSVFADHKREAIRSAAEAGRRWPQEWLSEAQSTYAILAQHPLSTDAEVARQYDFLIRLRAIAPADRVLKQGLERYPASWMLHERYRLLLLAGQGVDGIEKAYRDWMERPGAPAFLTWYAAQASVFAAEQLRRENRLVDADIAYQRSLGLFQRQREMDAETADSAAPYEVRAMAGRARLALESENPIEAQKLILKAFTHRPEAAALLDGLNVTPVGTARKILAALQEAGEERLALELQQALDSLGDLDTGLLELPDFERQR